MRYGNSRGTGVDRERYSAELQRTLVVTLIGVFTVVLLWLAVIIPSPRWEPVVELARSTSGVKAPEEERDLTVSVQASGRIFIADQHMAGLSLVANLRRYSSNPARVARPVRLRVDRSAPFSAVRDVLLAVRQARLSQVTFLVRAERIESLDTAYE
jgi:biopolymer transport protein ExbD